MWRTLRVLVLALSCTIPHGARAQTAAALPPVPPEFAGVTSQQGWALFQAGHAANVSHDFPTALRLLSQAIDQAPNFFLPCVDRGMVYYQMNDFNHAATDLTRGIELGKSFPMIKFAYKMLGVTYRQLKRPDDAVVIYSEYLKTAPDDWDGITGRGEAYALGNNTAAARADYERALVLSPNNPKLFGLMSVLDVQSNDWQRALTDSTHWLAVKPGDETATKIHQAALAHLPRQ